MKKQNSHLIINRVKSYKNLLFIFSLYIASCAQISAPTGGKKDTTPPVIEKSFPKNNTIEFHQKEIKIIFDEWIQPLQNAKSQVIITPSIDPFPKIEAARNELTIRLKDPLKENTTYSIFFGDNIKDNHEGNIYRDFKYIFSTGKFIDSLKIKGIIKTSLDKIPDNTYLLLYTQKEDSAFMKSRPFYITKISADGNFNLENVKEGDYRIYAISDKNGNYYYDLPTEAIGFTDSVFHIKANLDTLSFILFQPEEEKLRVYEFDRLINGGILHLAFNRELSFSKDEVTVSIAGNTDVLPIAFQEQELNMPQGKGGKIAVYFPKMKTDTSSMLLIVKNNGQAVDSLSVRMESRKSSKPVVYFNDTIAYKSLSVIESKPLKLISSYYSLSPIDTSRIFITDTSSMKIPFNVSREEDLRTYVFSAAWIPGMKYKLQIADSAFSDLVENYNKKQEFSFSVTPLKKAGNLLISYELPKKQANYIVLLKDNSGKVLDKRILRDSQAVKIDYGWLLPGTYNVEVIDDVNGNGIWNSGNFTTRKLPEKIYKEPKPVIVKENWDAEEKIKVDFNLPQNKGIMNSNINTEPINKNNTERKGVGKQ